MDPHEIRSLADGLVDTLASIDSGTLEATDSQRAFLAGALHALQALLSDSQSIDTAD